MGHYNNNRTNQGKRCQGRTPKQTWDAGYKLYKKCVIEKTEVTDEGPLNRKPLDRESHVTKLKVFALLSSQTTALHFDLIICFYSH
jgi:hypothetical protein